jgi:condensin complex subunit 3
LSTLEVLSGVYEDTDDKRSMVTPVQIASQLADWTDPRKAVCVSRARLLLVDRSKLTWRAGSGEVDEMVHVDVAIEAVRELYSAERTSACLFCQYTERGWN